jgi:hypothetical protein
MLAARLRLEQARPAASALETIGLAAAALPEEMQSTFIAGTHGRIALADSAANALFQDARIARPDQ